MPIKTQQILTNKDLSFKSKETFILSYVFVKYNFINSLSNEFFKLIVASDCQIISIGEHGDDEILDQFDLDTWDAVGQVEKIFKQEGVRPSRIEDYVLGLICDGKIVGGATFGSYNEDGQTVFTFSVAIDSKYQGRGFGKKLVQAAMDQRFGVEGYFYINVINPNMAKLLESMGFEEDLGGWSHDRPHMTYYP